MSKSAQDPSKHASYPDLENISVGPVSIPSVDLPDKPHSTPVRTVERYRPKHRFRRLGPKLVTVVLAFLFASHVWGNVPASTKEDLLDAFASTPALVGRVLGVETQGGSAIELSKVLDEDFNLSLQGFIEGSRLKATATSGAPLTISSTSLVTNLNSDLLDGQHGSYYIDQAVTAGGWVNNGNVVRLQTSTDKVGIGTSSPLSALHVKGDINTDEYYSIDAVTVLSVGYKNLFVGKYAGAFAPSNGEYNTFLGSDSGYRNTSGGYNVFVGFLAGGDNTTGNFNTFLGSRAGDRNTIGLNNTAVGYRAGYSNTTGSSNVFIGYRAGHNETGSNVLYIDNSDTSSPLIYGDFSSNTLGLNGNVGIGTASPDGTLHVHTGSAGTVTAHAFYEDLVVENSSDAGISILNPATSYGGLIFGSPTSNTRGWVKYYHPSDLLQLGTAGVDRVVLSASGLEFQQASTISTTASNNLTLDPGGELHIDASILEFNQAITLQNAGIDSILIVATDILGLVGNVGGTLINYNAIDSDTIIRGDNDSNLLFVNAGSDEVGIGIANPDGKLHVHTGSAGGVTADPAQDDLVVENSAGGGISILIPDASFGVFAIGSPSDVAHARILAGYTLGYTELRSSTDLRFSTGGASTEFLFNDAGYDADFRIESDASQYLFSMDAGTNAILIDPSNTGITPEGILHIHEGDAGSVTASPFADEIIIESDGIAGLSLLTPDLNAGFISWGSPLLDHHSWIWSQYDTVAANRRMQIGGAVDIELQPGAAREVVINPGSTPDVDFRVESDNLQYMFMVDGSADAVGVYTSSPDTNAYLTICATVTCTLPTTTATALVLGSHDDATTGVSIRARGTITGGLSDVGEYIKFEGARSQYTQGDVLVSSSTLNEAVAKSASAYQPNLLGVVTTTAGLIAGGGDETITYDSAGNPTNRVIIALAGRVPVKVATGNGAIQRGDFLTSSSKPGYAMKATQAGRVVGVALEPLSSGEGKIVVFVNPGWWDPGTEIVSDGTASVDVDIPDQLKVLGVEAEVSVFGKITSTISAVFEELTAKVAEIASAVIDTLKVGSLTVGEADAPAGITVYDEATGEPYCVFIENGELIHEPGECK